MEEILANVDDISFKIQRDIENQVGLQPLPFKMMDKSGAPICASYIANKNCEMGDSCPLRHIRGEKTVVCKHWLRGLCKKGDDCEFLHEYDMSKMPECWFYSKYNSCTNKECIFVHIDPATKKKDCPWYDRGFCRHGPNCRHKHSQRVICMSYVAGFCPAGPECRHAHPKFSDQNQQHNIQQPQRMAPTSSSSSSSSSNQVHTIQTIQPHITNHNMQPVRMARKPFGQVVCYKCGTLGHYANRCNQRMQMMNNNNAYQ